MIRLVILSAIAASVSGFVALPSHRASRTVLQADAAEEVATEEAIWDPLMLSQLGKNIDTFPNMFPDQQFVKEAEIKHGRMSMIAWTGIWATHVGGLGLGLHFAGLPVESDWTKALGVVAKEDPTLFGAVLLFIAIAEGESIGHSGDNFRGKSKKEAGDLGLDPLGLKVKLGAEEYSRYKDVEMKNGRAAMIAMASMFAFESIPGSVPFMDVLGAS